MSKPQQPELHRSGKDATGPASAKANPECNPLAGGAGDTVGPVPEDNLPAHQPDHDQDKPQGPPPDPYRVKSTDDG